MVRESLRRQFADRSWLADALAAAGTKPDSVARALARAEDIAARDTRRCDAEQDQPLTVYVHRIDLSDGALKITCERGPFLEIAAQVSVLAPTFSVPLSLHRNGRNRPIVLHTDTGARQRDADLTALVGDARRWMDDWWSDGRSRWPRSPRVSISAPVP